MEHDVEAGVAEHRQVRHVTSNEPHIERFPIRDNAITFQLFGRLIEDGDIGAGRREYWSLLSATRSKTKHVPTFHVAEPFTGHGFIRREYDLPVAETCARDHLRADWSTPLAPVITLLVPGDGVMAKNIRRFHNRTSSTCI